MKTKVKIILFLAIMAAFSSCRKGIFINGNNRIESETRQLNTFNKLANNGSFIVKIVNDTMSYVKIEAESNLIPYIQTYIDGEALVIDSRESINNHLPMRIEVHTKALVAAELNGSGEISFDHFSSDKFSAVLKGSGNIIGTSSCNSCFLKVDGSGDFSMNLFTKNLQASVEGSGDIVLVGECILSTMEIHGSGNIKYFDFLQAQCDALIDGSGNIYVNVSEQLSAKIQGSGSVYYIGNPIVLSDISGSGRVIKQ